MVLELISKISLIGDCEELAGGEYLLNFIGSTFHGTNEYKSKLRGASRNA